MKNTFYSLALLAALAATAGCSDVANALNAPLPGASAGTTVTPAGASPSAAPNANASAAPSTTTPAATAKPAASATPAGPVMGDPAITAADCAATKEDSEKDNGTEEMGDYNNQWMPKGWAAAYHSEAEVTAAIDKIKGADWACFQKFYPGASTVWKRTRTK